MSTRGKRGFESVADLGWKRLGLSGPRSRELRLAHAWVRVAGPVLAGRLEALQVQRGTLELRLTSVGGEWERTLAELLPEVAGRLAAECPDLGIRRCRLRDPEGEPLCSVEVTPLEAPTSADPAPARSPRRPREPQTHDRDEWLQRLMQRYLDRSEKRSG